MTRDAQRLQIARVKARTAVLKRRDVVSHDGWHHATTLPTRAAHRVLTQESGVHRAPLR
nr:hypothetical protein [Polaromonas eurypsychrophila]